MIAKIPGTDPERFTAVLTADEDLQHIVFDGIDGMPAARDLPDAVVSRAKVYLPCNEDEAVDLYRGSALEIETLFGVNRDRGHELPASAYRGVVRALAHHHRGVQPHRRLVRTPTRAVTLR